MISLANMIIQRDVSKVMSLLARGAAVNEIDEYGYTPLIESAIVDDIELAKLLLQYGANPNQKDRVGGTALHWAVENSNYELCRLLLDHQANPNSYNHSSEPIIVKSILREQKNLLDLFYQYGAQTQFAYDYIYLKLLGHRFDLQGSVDIVDTDGKFTNLSFEGFFLEFSLNLIRFSLENYTKHFTSKSNQIHFPVLWEIMAMLRVTTELIKYQQYRVDINQYSARIDTLIDTDLLIIPINYQGHALSFIRFGDLLVRCDRRKVHNALNGIHIFKMQHPEKLDKQLIRFLLYSRKNDEFIHEYLPQLLGLSLQGRLLIEPQMTGNCSWANVTACIPALYFLFTDRVENYSGGIIDFHHPALKVYREWRDWDKNYALHYCIKNFAMAGAARKASLAAALAAVLFQRFHYQDEKQLSMARQIFHILKTPGYEYILEQYVEFYCYRKKTQAGTNLKRLIEKLEEI